MSNGFMQWLLPTLLNGLFGVAVGALALMVVIPVQRLFKR
jgi:predicted DNA repair protein MutK